MNYEGLEIDMLNLGDADSILVTRWTNSEPTRILIDGGNRSDGEKVLDFLRGLGVKYLDHIVCSHPHDDHAAGLIEIINSNKIDFGHAWMHLPSLHCNFAALQSAISVTSTNNVKRILKDSLQTNVDLEIAIRVRYKPISEPFQGNQIGFLTVCGPTISFYEQQLAQFSDLEKLHELEDALTAYEHRTYREENQQLGLGSFLGLSQPTYLAAEDIGLGEAPTEPENETSTILGFVQDSKTCLLTADAGTEALNEVRKVYALQDLWWMQIPHHGSRRNVNEDLINYFKPTTAYVSAAGNTKHPRRKVVNAFKDVGTSVYSTHYQGSEGGNLWYRIGDVPPRSNYGDAVSLYNREAY
jgi:beta-lactamase superfamily II metal-dependent hydrolase